MYNPPPENAMTEIALALAMGFFSIMVLTLISFGTPAGLPAAIAVAPNTDNAPSMGRSDRRPDDLIVIVDGNSYLSTELQSLTSEAINSHAGRIVLAVDPATPLQQVVRLRGNLRADNLIVAEQNSAWRDALSARRGGGK